MSYNIKTPEEILSIEHYSKNLDVNNVYRDGIILEKGAVLSNRKIDQNIKFFQKYCWYWSIYPDRYIEEITPVGSKFKLKFFQKLFLRVCLRHGRIATIAPRAAGKSFICILALYLICIFRPHSRVFICSPGKAQSAKISKAKLDQLFLLLPALKWELEVENYGADYTYLKLKNGSEFTVMTPLNSTRGQRATFGTIDEYRDHTAEDISSIILPLLNVNRPMENQDLNPKEPQQGQLWISSASDKNTFAYDKTIELLELAIVNPKNAFVWGFDWQIPVKTGLLSQSYLNEMRLDKTFSESGFAKEYMSRFVGSSSDAWFDFDKLLSRRRLVNPETRARISDGSNAFYVLAVDVGRRGCQSVCVVLKVYPNSDHYNVSLVNIYVLGKTEDEKRFDQQVLELKRLIEKFNPEQVVIDINGLGIGVADLMVVETFDPQTQQILPAYGFTNREEYEELQPRNCRKILYGIKANTQLNSDMHTALFAKVYSGHLTFLISEKKAKEKLQGTLKGRRMPIEERIKRLYPHELTTHLINEIMNLKVKPAGTNNQIAVEQINKRVIKDKFSALEMGIYYISEKEKEEISHKQNRGLGRQLSFFKVGGGIR